MSKKVSQFVRPGATLQTKRRRHRGAAAAAVAGMALLAAACGSSSHSSSGTTSGGASGSSGGSASQAAGGNSSQAAAKAIIQKYTPRPTDIGISTPVGKPIPKGKTVAFLECTIPSCTVLAGYTQAAGKALGWNVKVINAGLTPETVKAAYDQAISDNVDAVIGTGFPKTIFGPELATLASRHIPVIELSSGDLTGGGITASFETVSANQEYGQLQADWVYGTEGTKANTLVIGVPTFPTITILETAFKAKYKQLCPSCALGEVDVTASDLGTPSVSSKVVGYLQSHPSVNVIETSDSDAVIGLPAALAAASLHPKIIVLDSSPTVASYIKAGTVSVTTAAPWNTLMWLAMDTLARVFTNQPITPDLNWTHPEWFVTASNIPSTTQYFGVVPPAINDAAFEKLWGVSGS